MALKYCQTCGTVAEPRTFTRGSFIIELFLWLLFIVPGLIYSLWRLTSRAQVCAKCGSRAIIPLDSPNAQNALAARPVTSVATSAAAPQPIAVEVSSAGGPKALVAAMVLLALLILGALIRLGV